LEIFTGSGEVLSTRLYRGSSPHGHPDAGIEFVALDGEATLERVAAYDMARCAHASGRGHSLLGLRIELVGVCIGTVLTWQSSKAAARQVLNNLQAMELATWLGDLGWQCCAQHIHINATRVAATSPPPVSIAESH
jgi:hypothetical protein